MNAYSSGNISPHTRLAHNSRMDISEIRKANLELLIDEFRSAAEIARRADTSAAYLSQIRSGVKSKSGKMRSVGDQLARDIERGTGKPHGWMDSYHGIQAVNPDQIPLLTLKEAGAWAPTGNPYLESFESTVDRPTTAEVGSRGYAIEILDDSLQGLAPCGSILAIDPSIRPENGKICVFHLAEFGETYVGIYVSRAGKESLKFLDGSDSVSLQDAQFCGRAKVLMAKEL